MFINILLLVLENIIVKSILYELIFNFLYVTDEYGRFDFMNFYALKPRQTIDLGSEILKRTSFISF